MYNDFTIYERRKTNKSVALNKSDFNYSDNKQHGQKFQDRITTVLIQSKKHEKMRIINNNVQLLRIMICKRNYLLKNPLWYYFGMQTERVLYKKSGKDQSRISTITINTQTRYQPPREKNTSTSKETINIILAPCLKPYKNRTVQTRLTPSLRDLPHIEQKKTYQI